MKRGLSLAIGALTVLGLAVWVFFRTVIEELVRLEYENEQRGSDLERLVSRDDPHDILLCQPGESCAVCGEPALFISTSNVSSERVACYLCEDHALEAAELHGINFGTKQKP